MGSNTSKIKDIIFVTGADLDPPELHAKRENRPEKQVKIQYGSYGAKKYWKEDATDEELKTYMAKVEKKQNLLKQFKQYKDFDRIDYQRNDSQVTIFEYFLQQSLKVNVFLALALSRILAMRGSLDYFTVGTWRKLFWPSLLLMLPTTLYKNITSDEYHIINHEYFRMLPQEQTQYVEADLKYNIYKDVQNIKYNFKYPSLNQYYKTRRYILDTVRDNKKSMYKELYQYQLGLKADPLEQFANFRKKQRKGNWDILTPEQKVIIEQQIKMRSSQGQNPQQ